ncbi:hypothetical protein EAE96_008897 [Botrytis aclada]|nr:hypothetical protein EAE96_008897 [Botrytis aclada]
MSLQQTPNEQSDNPSIPPANSQAKPRIPTGLHSLPMEIIGQISEESMREDALGTNPGNVTRNLPAFIASLKCGVNDPWRGAYIHTLDACSKSWVYSLHFGNNWKLPMDSEEGGLVQNIVIKYLPEIWKEHPSHPSPLNYTPTQYINNASDANAPTLQPIVDKDARYYYWYPMPEVVNSSLDNLPSVRSVQLEFKTFCVSFGAKCLGMCRTLQVFLGNHKDFKLKSAKIETPSREPGPNMKRIVIKQVTAMVGHDVCFDLTEKGIWTLKDHAKNTDTRLQTVRLDLENNVHFSYPSTYFSEVVKVLRGCKWTWVFEREEK